MLLELSCRFLSCLFAFGFLHGCGASPGVPLVAESSIRCRELSALAHGGEVWPLQPDGSCYRFTAQSGDGIRLEIGQVRGDLSATVEDPDGKPILTFDTPVDDAAPERPCFVAEESGVYRLHLESEDSQAAATVRLLAVRPATTADRACAEAARRFLAAMDRLKAGKTRKVGEELTAAADLWRRGDDPLSEAMARRTGARVWRDLGEYQTAETELERTLVAARQAENIYLELSALNRLGVVHWYRGALEASERVLFEALAVARTEGDRSAEATAYNNLSLVDETRGNITRAIRRLRQAEAIQRAEGMLRDLSLTLHNLALDLALRSHFEEAFIALEEAESLAREANAQSVRLDCLLTRGWIHRLQGNPQRAEAPLREVLGLWREEGNVVGQAVALDRLGTVLFEIGDARGAEAAYREAVAIVPPSTPPSDLAPTYASLGCVHQQEGNLTEAQRWLQRARQAYRGVDDPISLAHLEYCTSLVAQEAGDLDTALVHIERAMDIVEGMKNTDRSQGARHRPIDLWQGYAERQVAQWVALSEETDDPTLLDRAFSIADYARARGLFELVWEAELPEQRQREEEEALRDRLRELAEQRRRLGTASDAKAEDAAAIERQATVVACLLYTSDAADEN